MRHTRSYAIASLVALVATTVSARPYAGSRHAAATPAYRITDVRAQLFYSDRGTFSRNILAPPKPNLWNTIIGAGGAGGPSHATLLTVEVSGPPDSYGAERQVEIRVTTGGRDVVHRRLPLGIIGEAGHTYVALWLEKTGCQPLRIVTSLVGQPDPSRHVSSIPFECGE